MDKYQFTIGELTFLCQPEGKKHVDVFIDGISSAIVSGLMTKKDIEQLCDGLKRVKEQM